MTSVLNCVGRVGLVCQTCRSFSWVKYVGHSLGSNSLGSKRLTKDTTEINRIKVNRTINELKSSHLLNEKIANDLLSSEAKTPQFKMLPKVHKEGNPGRPVVSSIDCHTTKISKYIDNQLQPRVKELKSYVKDSTQVICQRLY